MLFSWFLEWCDVIVTQFFLWKLSIFLLYATKSSVLQWVKSCFHKKWTSLLKVHYFFIWTRWGRKILNNWNNFKEQMYHTLIVQNEETWTWCHFRSHADCFQRTEEPFLRYAIVVPYFWLWFSKTYSAWYYNTTGRHTYRVSGHPFESQGYYDLQTNHFF